MKESVDMLNKYKEQKRDEVEDDWNWTKFCCFMSIIYIFNKIKTQAYEFYQGACNIRFGVNLHQLKYLRRVCTCKDRRNVFLYLIYGIVALKN